MDLLHALARPSFAIDLELGGPDPESPAASSFETQSTDQQVRATPAWIELSSDLCRRRVPRFLVDQRDLAPASLVGITDESGSRAKLCPRDRIHLPAMSSLDPNG